MLETILFDWGDTLMVDFPDQTGKMCDWPQVSAVDGAQQLLASLSKRFNIFVATGAADSSVNDIKRAFQRVGLDSFISRYYCHENLGVGKESSSFYELILKKLDVPSTSVLMVGDNLARDIIAANKANIHAVWYNSLGLECPAGISSIRHLSELEGAIVNLIN